LRRTEEGKRCETAEVRNDKEITRKIILSVYVLKCMACDSTGRPSCNNFHEVR